ncbi:MAG: 16S rRNA (cytosine(1402)-N(4))-methyltransferase RsmH [Bacilli bacterium]|nr:16S rRNA (cytosine(1402)-N(4))-methyltransferase RsmH [Bacilli bacterium]MBN2877711.1 16S rRNA (cytosine(1402)-N(4))-methyltransferase RsmH [Bacilli bacterium]
MVNKMNKHIPVMLQEVIENLNIKDKGIYVDMTLGGAGHSYEIIKRIPNGFLYGFDQDDFAIKKAGERLAEYGNFRIIRDNFVNAKARLKELGVTKVDGILFDLGVSSFQFDIPERGFSYNADNDLDMRMDIENNLTAKVILNTYPEQDIADILFRYGEEKFSRSIAKNIVKARKNHPIQTTFELVDIIKHSMPMKELSKKGHPAKKTFQALRIAVNDELNVLTQALEDAITLLKPHGRLAVITFHSLEDRIVKQIFRNHSTIDIPEGVPILVNEDPEITLVNRKVITASEEELERNNRAHSAKLRVIEKNKK